MARLEAAVMPVGGRLTVLGREVFSHLACMLSFF
jgi:hypothetical protein